jgi:hypothetical protein
MTNFEIPENANAGIVPVHTVEVPDLNSTISMSKRLTTPRRSSSNFMMNVSREKRTLQYVPEIEKGNLNKFGPGPAKYDLCKSFVDENLTKNRFTFNKTLRNLSGTIDRDEKRLPISYTSPEVQLKLQKKVMSKPIIGNYKQKFDVTKMSAVNSHLWKKGIIFY